MVFEHYNVFEHDSCTFNTNCICRVSTCYERSIIQYVWMCDLQPVAMTVMVMLTGSLSSAGRGGETGEAALGEDMDVT
jgi:hypothetical protein